MAAFSYQQPHPFLLDSTTHLLSPLQHHVEEMSNASSSCFFYYHNPDLAILESPPIIRDSKSYLDSSRQATPGDNNKDHCSSAVLEPHQPHGAVEVTKPQGSILEKKRKNSDGSCLTCVGSIDPKEEKAGRRQKKTSGGDEVKKPRATEKKENKTCGEPPEGYIHVRARRGQATDSHSLAERLRREKISERMKLLQALVPGCEKVTGKALMLDEIINYVQSLQNQIEFLSMKLASVNPLLYDFGVDFDGQTNQMERLESLSQGSQALPSVNQNTPFQPRACESAVTSYPVVDSSPAFLLHGQGPMALSQFQDNCNLLMQVGEQRQGLLNQLLNNKCSFQ